MSKNDIYKNYKGQIKELADSLGFSDKPLRRMTLNDELDGIRRELSINVLCEQITQRKADQITSWLESYVIRRHNK